MNIILTVGILLILYGIFAKRKYSVAVGMFFVLLIMGFQEGIPGDFMAYKFSFNHGGVDTAEDGIKETEYAYIWLTQTLSKFMNFNVFVFLTSLVQCFAIGLMIRDYADKRYWSFGVILFFFSFNLMLIQMKAMRQGYAVDCLFLAYWLLSKRRFVLSLLMAAIAYGFHNSTIVALLFFIALYVLMFFKRNEKMGKSENMNTVLVNKNAFSFATLVAIGLVAFTVLKFTVIDMYVKTFVETLDFFQYDGYFEEMEDRGLAWWIILYETVSVFVVSLYYRSEKNFFNKYLALISIISFFAYVGFFGMGSLFRVSMFFDIFAVVVYPNVAGMLRNSYGKHMATYYIIFNMVFLMYLSVQHMLSMSIESGFGYGMFRFSFM